MLSIIIGIIAPLLLILLWKHIEHQLKYGHLRKVFCGINYYFVRGILSAGNPDNALRLCTELYENINDNGIQLLYPGARLLVFEPKLAEFILSTNLDKTMEYSFIKSWLLDGILTAKTAKWKGQKKLLAPAFSKENLQKHIDVFNEQSLILCEKLQQHVDGKSFDIHKLTVLCTLDVILNTALGANSNIQSNPTSDYFSSVQTMCNVLYTRTFNLILCYDFFYKFSSLSREEKKAAEILNTFSQKLIQDRRNLKQVSGIRTILDMLLESEEFTDEEICAELNTIIFAGHETTGATLSFALYELSRNPEIQTKVYNEIIDVVGEFNAPTYKDLESLTYTSMFLREISRLYPGVPVFTRQITKEIRWKGEVLPKGLNCYIPLIVLHRIEKYFPNAEKCDPARFSAEDEKSLPNGGAYMPFSTAPRGCIGQKFAQLEMKTVLVNLLRTYAFLPDPEHEIKLIAKVTLMSKNGVKLKVIKRQH